MPIKHSTKNNKKLPANIAQMVEKNNLVMAITTLSGDEGISFDEAKQRIDSYEEQLKQKQQAQQDNIAKKQAKKTATDTQAKNSFATLQAGVDKKFNEEGYKKPLFPYWLKRVAIIVTVMLILMWGFWQLVR